MLGLFAIYGIWSLASDLQEQEQQESPEMTEMVKIFEQKYSEHDIITEFQTLKVYHGSTLQQQEINK